jgi:hypothetical protein
LLAYNAFTTMHFYISSTQCPKQRIAYSWHFITICGIIYKWMNEIFLWDSTDFFLLSPDHSPSFPLCSVYLEKDTSQEFFWLLILLLVVNILTCSESDPWKCFSWCLIWKLQNSWTHKSLNRSLSNNHFVS